ncbi:MAG: biofilm development regulator YmgB/AriR family protein [Pantoea sp.]|uniref:biofilm development regulator YmgB/AriR family protein n=1 Tax=Pantoea TaxID=53335 RepID=UPI002396F68A|nr:biofilm development regulator YmgB/AriR family protein [Pantoea sp.]MDE1186215.1 biofilm development regulator YmgB/AriR family protein [Pantoea sp.]
MVIKHPSEAQIDDCIKSLDPLYVKAKAVIIKVENNLLLYNKMISNKKTIEELVKMLESEKDPSLLDTYRMALQIILEQTPDDVYQ